MLNGADLLSDHRLAIFNEDRTHRFLLKRKIKPGDSICLFAMLNPSTASEHKNDNTVSRCIKFADQWGFSWMWVVNIFSICSSDPKVLYLPGVINEPLNDEYIGAAVDIADRTMCAWGNHGNRIGRGDQVAQMIRDRGKVPFAFGLTNPLTGTPQPKHPLARGKNWIPYGADIVAL